MDLLSTAAGAALVAAGYLVYFAATKGLPAAYARLKGWWNAGKAQATRLQSDIDAAHVRITALEQQLAKLTGSMAAAPGVQA